MKYRKRLPVSSAVFVDYDRNLLKRIQKNAKHRHQKKLYNKQRVVSNTTK